MMVAGLYVFPQFTVKSRNRSSLQFLWTSPVLFIPVLESSWVSGRSSTLHLILSHITAANPIVDGILDHGHNSYHLIVHSLYWHKIIRMISQPTCKALMQPQPPTAKESSGSSSSDEVEGFHWDGQKGEISLCPNRSSGLSSFSAVNANFQVWTHACIYIYISSIFYDTVYCENLYSIIKYMIITAHMYIHINVYVFINIHLHYVVNMIHIYIYIILCYQ